MLDRDVWKKYLRPFEASRQAEALYRTLEGHGWTLVVEEDGAPGRN